MKLNIQLFADGKVVIDTKLNTKNFENGLDRMQNTSQKAGNTIKNIVAGLGITKIISKGLSVISSSIDGAVKRVDTLNNFPKVMQSLGISAQDAEKSIKKMSDKLAGLPTTLDQGASAVKVFTSYNGDVKKSTDIFLALNNAILAGGASTQAQTSALEQLTQAYTKGKPEAQDWKTIMQAMPAQLKQIAKTMGYTSATIGGDFYEALQKGEITMDDFMDTVIQLNEKGGEGFESFTKQAKAGTEGIGTAITNAKTQVVKGVADIISGLDKSFKKSGTSISKIVADMGNSIRKYLSSIGNALSKINFKKLINTIKNLIPLIGSLTAGFLAYNSVLKVLKLQKTISNFGSLAKQLLTLTPAIKGANSATIALNGSLAVSPIGLLIAGVAGLTAGFWLLQKASLASAEGNQKTINTLNEYNKAIKESDKARQSYLDKNMNEIQSTENLYLELQALVDENGKIKSGYEDRAKFITGELSKALGIEIKLNDGIIESYDKIKESVANVIEAKRAETLIKAQEKKYNTAKDEATKLEQAYAEQVEIVHQKEEKRKKVLEQIKDIYGLTNKQLEEVSKTMGYTNKNGEYISISLDEMGKKLMIANNQLEGSKTTLQSVGEEYASNQQIIGNYEYALGQMSQKNYEAVLKMYEDTTNYQGKTIQDTIQKQTSALESQKQYLEFLKQNRKNYNKEVYDAEVSATEARIKKIEESLQQENAKISSGQSVIKNTWKTSLAEQLSEITGHKIQFTEVGKGNIQAWIDGQKQGKPMSKKEAKQFADDMSSILKKQAKSGGKEGGRNFVKGFDSSINAEKGSSFTAVRNYGQQILKEFKASLDEHSPSKATKEMGINFDKGFAIGVDKEKNNSLKTVKNYGQDMISELDNTYSRMQKSINLEQGKLQANVETGRVFNTLQNTTPIKIELQADVEMEAQKVGRIITPHILRTIKTGGGYQ